MAEVRSMRRKRVHWWWGGRRKGWRELEGAWAGWEGSPAAGQEGRGEQQRNWEETMPAALVTEQNNTCQRQGHLSTEGVRTGSKNFLPPERSHPSLQGSTGWGLLLLRAGSGPQHPTPFLPSNRWERPPRSCNRWEIWVSSRTHAVSSLPHYSGQSFPGQRAASHHPCLLGRGPPCSPPTLHTGAPSDWALHWVSTQNSCTYFPLFYPVNVASHPTQRRPKRPWCLRTHNSSRSNCPSSVRPGFLWDWSFPAHGIRF